MKPETKKKDLWDEWILFKKNDYTNPTLQLKKQGANFFKGDQYGEFTYRPSYLSPPSMQEFYESILNGIIKRNQLGLYKGEYSYYLELQICLHEFTRLMNFKSEILIEVFQTITGLNLSKEQYPNIVLPCFSCGMFIYINFHCKNCLSAFYCDKTCMKNHKNKHDLECKGMTKITPCIFYPLQVEIHCGGDLGDDIQIFFEHEMRVTLKYRGFRFLNNLHKVLLKNRWLKNYGYNVIEDKENCCILLQYNTKEEEKDRPDEDNLSDSNLQGEEDLYLKMPIIQEIKVIFLNQGAILQDIVKETYEQYNHFIHIYFFPC